MIRGALFDLDGVLIDSETTYTTFWADIERIYPTGIPNFALAIKGTTLVKILQNYPSQAVRDDIVRRIDEFEATMEYPIYDGVYQLLDILSEHAIPTAIVTSSSDEKMTSLRRKLPGFLERFDAVITGSDVSRSKPDPQGYLLAAERIGIPSNECAVFEDSIQGLMAGRAAGAKVVALATTNSSERLSGLADIILPDISHVDWSTLSRL